MFLLIRPFITLQFKLIQANNQRIDLIRDIYGFHQLWISLDKLVLSITLMIFMMFDISSYFTAQSCDFLSMWGSGLYVAIWFCSYWRFFLVPRPYFLFITILKYYTFKIKLNWTNKIRPFVTKNSDFTKLSQLKLEVVILWQSLCIKNKHVLSWLNDIECLDNFTCVYR